MHVIAIVSQKGGVGKSTLAVHLAVAATRAGLSCRVYDADPQQSASAWHRTRVARGADELEPDVAPIELHQLGPALKADAKAGLDLALIDTPGKVDATTNAIARLADFVLMPCRPSAFDLAAAAGTAAIAKAARKPAAFVLSACPHRAPEIADTREELQGLGLPVAPPEITDRRAFARAVIDGRAVHEFDPEGRAAAEIDALFSWLKTEMTHHG